MRAGRLNRRVKIQYLNTEYKNERGETTPIWADLDNKTIWAEVKNLSGKEYWSAMQVESAVNVRVCIRYRADITAKMRVIYGARQLNIKAAIDVEDKHDELQLMCEEIIEYGTT